MIVWEKRWILVLSLLIMWAACYYPAIVWLQQKRMTSNQWLFIAIVFALGAFLFVRTIQKMPKPIRVFGKRWEIAICLFIMSTGCFGPVIVWVRHGQMTGLRWGLAGYFFALGAILLLKTVRPKK
jgi:hypothetical protein